ncbi:MAG: zinc-dependent alcohol dehydrogenase family protein [Phycisphaeraceae bacterium]
MYKIVVHEFGGIEKLDIVEQATPAPAPGSGQVVIRIISIGMNHAELMSRRGEYKIASGEPPFVPGLEAGGIIEAVGPDVTTRTVGQRVILGADAPRRAMGGEGTYQSHYLTTAEKTVPAPAGVPDLALGALWLPYLTAWGCLVWKQNVQAGQYVLIPAASSAVAMAAAQLVKDLGAIAIGTTTSPEKVAALKAMPECKFDHIVVTRDAPWWKEVKQITGGHGCDVIFDPVAAGEFLNTEIRLLAERGTLWVYGLLGTAGTVDVTPLIRLKGAIRGWALTELAAHAPGSKNEPLQRGYAHILDRVADGRFKLPIAGTFGLRDVRRAHEEMEKGKHIGKLILVP